MIKKLLLVLFGFFVLLLVACFSIPFLFKDKIAAMAKEEMDKSLNARINIGDINLSLLKNIKQFPNITLGLEDFQIIGKDQFYKDTLVSLKELDIALDLMSVIKSEKPMKIHAIRVHEANIHAIVDRQGKVNWDITKNKSESSSDPYSLNLKSLEITKTNIRYSDFAGNQFLTITDFNHSATGDFTQDVFDYTHKTFIGALSFKQNNIAYLSKAILKYDGTFNIDQKDNRYTFKENIIKLNDLGLKLNGWLQNKANGDKNMDLTFKADESSFKSIISMVPAIYSNNFDNLKTSGSFNLSGNVKGIYKTNWYPKFDIALDIIQGKFQYPSLPVAVSNVNIKTKITNPGGSLDKTIVQIPTFSMMLGAESVQGRLTLMTPISNPNIDMMAKGKLNLANVSKFYPLTPGTKISGITNIDLELKSSQSDIQLKHYDKVKALGYIQMFGFLYDSKDIPKPIQISQFELKFSPSFVELAQCKTKIGNSDFDFSGRLDNIVGYALSKNQVLTGNINMRSNYIDANEFLADSNETKNAKSMQTGDEYFKVPANIDFSGLASINKIKYEKMDITEVSGTIRVKDETAILKATKANLLGGNMQINGVYATKNGDKPTGDLTYNITGFDMRQVFTQVESAKKLAPILQYVQGTFSSDMNISTKINADLSPDLNSTNGTAKFMIPSASISNVPLLNNIASVTKLSQLNNLSLSNTEMSLNIQNGRIHIQPFNFKSGNTNMVISGSQGLDQSIDYKMAIDVPWEELGAASGMVDNLLKGSPIAGLAGNLKPEKIRLNLLVGGTFNKPSVKMGKPEAIKGNGQTTGNTVQNMVQQQIDDTKAKAEEAAQKALDSARRAAEQKAEQIKQEAQRQAQQKIEEQKTKVIDQLKKKLPW